MPVDEFLQIIENILVLMWQHNLGNKYLPELLWLLTELLLESLEKLLAIVHIVPIRLDNISANKKSVIKQVLPS